MILYLDNIRGFNNQLIELNEVNFLVGENSTGKSTIISLVSLFSDFTFPGEFKNKFVDFGPFTDIVTKGRNKKNEFTVGFKKQKNNLGKLKYDEILMHYGDDNGFPGIRKVSFRVKEKILVIIFKENSVSYFVMQSKYNENDLNWTIEHHNEKSKSLEGNYTPDNSDYYQFEQLKKNFLLAPWFISNSKSQDMLKDFRNPTMLSESSLLGRSIWIDPLRSKPQRIYEPQKINYSSEGEHIPTVLRDIFLNKDKKNNKEIIEGIEQFGIASGLFDEIKIDQYRKSKDSPFSLIFKLKNKSLKISNVGYGVSQIIPILTEVLREKGDSIFLIQQPEVHLHPKSQAFFGEFIFDQFITSGKHFIIETHSDFLIDRFRMKMKANYQKNLNRRSNILFFESNGKNNIVTRIKMDNKGDYSDDQPEKFRAFFLKEELQLLGF